jgi:hypothetical protein
MTVAMPGRRLRHKLLSFVVLTCVALAVYVFTPPSPRHVSFPGGKRFAVSIVDDTDQTTLERVKPLYDLMFASGMRTTKTVWVLPRSDEPVDTNKGETLQDAEYRAFILDLKRKGFEVALHGVRGGSSRREETAAGLEEFQRVLGAYPRMHVNHALNRDDLYWGEHRWSFPPYRWGFAMARAYEFSGHLPESKYFWGDLAKRHIKYVRRFTFSDINLLRANPWMPYALDSMPYVNYWFETSNGGSIEDFDELLRPENLDRLEREGGVSLIYAHLGAGSFSREGRADPRFERRIKELTSRNGWFAPASEILDHLSGQPGWQPDLSLRQRIHLETKFLLDRIISVREVVR